MIKYDINTDKFELPLKSSTAAMSASDVFSAYLRLDANAPTLVASFDTLEQAREAFAKYDNYGSTSAVRGTVSWLLLGELAWIEAVEYDDDGEPLCGGDVFDFSAEGYEPEEA